MIYLVRHSKYTPSESLAGDGYLSKEGILQSERLAKRFIDEKIDITKVYSSPLIRARETADILCKALFLPDKINSWDLVEETIDETREDTIERMSDFFNNLSCKSGQEDIIAVSHSFAIKYFLNSLDKNLNRSVLPHAGVTLLDFSNSENTILDYNPKSHLDGITSY